MTDFQVGDLLDEMFSKGLQETLYALYSPDGGEYQGPHPFKLLCASYGLTEAYIGCTKAVVVSGNTVLKFPLIGEASAEFIDGSTEILAGEPYMCDHCAVESEVYERARQDGLSYMFNKLHLVDDTHTSPVYACMKAEHVSMVGDIDPRTVDAEVLRFFDKTNAEYWIADRLIEENGKYNTLALCEFLDSNGIYDICSENWGERNGRLVLIDYSDFVG